MFTTAYWFLEYLLKQYLQTSKQEPIYLNMWDESLAGIKKHLITYSSPSNFTVLAERPNGLGGSLHPKMDHLVCFIPGTIALSTTAGLSVEAVKKKSEWDGKKEDNLELAKELMKTCWGMYKVTKTGLAPEITYFKVHDGSHMYSNGPLKSPATLDPSADADWRHDFEIKPADTHNLLRPETVESLFYMWRITGDEMYRHWGWEMFQSFLEHTSVPDGAGFSSIGNVNEIPAPHWDNMESFWPVSSLSSVSLASPLECTITDSLLQAETLKYFFLLFSPNDLLPLDKVVFNTEAHAFPHFELGKLFSTGWRRKPRDKDGLIIQEGQPHQVVRVEKKTMSVKAVD
jgi:endoplasmic reticulum Man9GlcNAc2 1,2-alpha-mannosidase